jgi:hypothetical protein
MDGYFDDFDDDLRDGFIEDEFEDDVDDICDGEMDENETLGDDESMAGIQESNSNGPVWQDWMIIGPMSEQIAEEKREQDRIERNLFGDDFMESETDW